MVYGLTKGQASPTSEYGFATKTQPYGVLSDSLNPLALALSQGVGFVARGYCSEVKHLSSLIRAAMEYPGFSMIDILQVCVTFNPVNTFQFYKERAYLLDDENHPTDNWHAAMDLAMKWGDRIPVGLIYQKETLPYTKRVKILEKGPLLNQTYDSEGIQETLDGQ